MLICYVHVWNSVGMNMHINIQISFIPSIYLYSTGIYNFIFIFILQVVCEATQSTNTQIKVAALQCLVKIMSLYYQYMEHYMGPALFAVSIYNQSCPILQNNAKI